MRKQNLVFLFILLIFLVSCNKNDIDYASKEKNLENTLKESGVEADIHYTDRTVTVIYPYKPGIEENNNLQMQLLLQAHKIFPDAKIKLFTENNEMGYYTETDSKTIEKYLNGKLTREELNQSIKKYKR